MFENILNQDNISRVTPLIVDFVGNIVYALIVLVVGWWVIKRAVVATKSVLSHQKIDPAITSFATSLVGTGLKIILLISVLSLIGIETTSFIALLGAAGFAIGAALSGTLQNFAAGVIVLFLKPYKVGDFITAQDISGFVKEVQIFNTIVKTPSNETIIIPNAQITSGIIKNHSTEPLRRVDMTFGIGYTDDIDLAKKVVKEVLDKEPLVVSEKEAVIEVAELGDNSVNLAVYPWVKQEDYIQFTVTLPEKIKKAFDANNISIPFPQRDVHLIKE